MNDSVEISLINRFLSMIDEIKHGLDPDVLADWYRIIEADAKALCPEELRDSISVKQDPILWMKFEFRASRRAVPYVIEAIEKNLDSMPFATRLYFQKLEEMIIQEYSKPIGIGNDKEKTST
ncbi:MAG: hypothetical protein RMJ31_01585 [Nitrososphaerota archaeon]|nr:hypothetical protein [Nitrososphaerales archaeon]MDW8044452.1 hypothetical protein [Nitrososphaerota archaeon]